MCLHSPLSVLNTLQEQAQTPHQHVQSTNSDGIAASSKQLDEHPHQQPTCLLPRVSFLTCPTSLATVVVAACTSGIQACVLVGELPELVLLCCAFLAEAQLHSTRAAILRGAQGHEVYTRAGILCGAQGLEVYTCSGIPFCVSIP